MEFQLMASECPFCKGNNGVDYRDENALGVRGNGPRCDHRFTLSELEETRRNIQRLEEDLKSLRDTASTMALSVEMTVEGHR